MNDDEVLKNEDTNTSEPLEEEANSGTDLIEELPEEVADFQAEVDPENASGDLEPTDSKTFCIKCGSELMEGQLFCPKCGHKVGALLEGPEPLSEQDKFESKKTGGKKIVIGIIAALLVIGAGILLFLVIRGVQAKEIVLNKDSLSVKAGESDSLKFTINPDNTKDKTVTWSTSNDTIATVSQGTVTGVNEGTCTITVKTSNGKTDTCEITVTPAGPDLVAIYNEYCSSLYASVASDGSYLEIDTNPFDLDGYNDSDAMTAIYSVDDALGIPDSVEEKMNHTRSIDGRQTYDGDGVEVSWSYHPDNGLEVIYSLTGK